MRICALFFFLILCGFFVRAELVADLDFNENLNGYIPDKTGRGNDCWIKGKFLTVEGPSGRATRFLAERENSCAVSPQNFKLNIRRSFSIEICFKCAPQMMYWSGLVSKGSAEQGYQLLFNSKEKKVYFCINTGKTGYLRMGGTEMVMNNWNYVVAVYDYPNKTARLYKNGVLCQEVKSEGEVKGFRDDFMIGSSIFGDFNGSIQFVKIHDTPLSDDVVAEGFRKLLPGLEAVKDDSSAHESDKRPSVFKKVTAKIENGNVVLYFSIEGDVSNAFIPGMVIYRKRIENYKFGSAPFVTKDDAEEVFRGKLPLADNRFVFVDDNVKHTNAYSYWVFSGNSGEAWSSPVCIRVRNPEIWWNEEKINSCLRKMAEENSGIAKIKEYGKTVEGHPLLGVVIGNPRCTVALVGAVHAGESGPELIIPALEKLLKYNKPLLAKVGIAALPCVNIDSRMKMVEGAYNYIRTNANGVDLNRNFPENWECVSNVYGCSSDSPKSTTYRGTAPFSEPETRAVIEFINDTRPAILFSFHSLASLCNASFLYPKIDNRAINDVLQKYASVYARGMYGRDWLKYYVAESGDSVIPGTLPLYAVKKYKIPAFDLELDENPEGRIVHRDSVSSELIRKYQEFHYKGILEVMMLLANESGAMNDGAGRFSQ